MNISTLAGALVAAIVVFLGVTGATSNYKIFFDLHAFIVVAGGTLAATLVSFPLPLMYKIIKILFNRVIKNSSPPHIAVVEEIVKLAKGNYSDPEFLSKNVNSIKNYFLKEAIQLQLDGGMSDAKIDVILRKRAEVHFVRYDADSHVFKTMARFPPAFGLMGAVLGMVALMSSLGSPDSFKTVGPSLAIALVATLYGIALANFVFVPLGENLAKYSKEDHLMRNIVIDGNRLLREKEHPLVVEEYLKSYLLTTEREKLSLDKKAA